jgi:hypothetical protein
MDFHVAAVERDLFGCVDCSSDRRKYFLPNAALAPAREAIVDCLVRPILGWTILPTAANALHVHDAAQNPSIILSFRTGLIGRQMPLDFRPLLIAEPKQARIHGWPPESVDQILESTHG